MSQCIYCGTSKDLNTQLTITLDDGVRHTVDICDEHAEEASIKSAKTAFLEKQTKIQAVLEQAKALGLTISESGGLVIAQAEPQPQQQPKEPMPEPTPQPPKPQSGLELQEDGFIPTERIDRNRSFTSVGGSTTMGQIAAHSSYDTSAVRGELPENALKGKVKMAVVEGREGQPLAVPQQRVDGTGTTRINIRKTEDDRKLQERFKKMAANSMHDNAPDFARSGYTNTTATCPICHGDGDVRMGRNSQICPKCGGSGIISTS